MDDDDEDDSGELQDILEESSFERDEIDEINEHRFIFIRHMPKIKGMIDSNPDKFVFEAQKCLPDKECQIVVFSNKLQKFISACINRLGEPVKEDLRDAWLQCFQDEHFISTQQRHKIDETFKLSWI